MLYKLFSTKVDQRYLQLVHWYKRRHTSYPSRFVFMADRSMHCVMLNNQSFRASVAGDKSRDLQANEGVCSQGAGREGLVGWAEKKYLKDITLIVLCRRVQLNSIKTNPKEILFAFHFSSCKFWIHHYKVNLWLIVKKHCGFSLFAQFSRKVLTLVRASLSPSQQHSVGGPLYSSLQFKMQS